MQTLTPTRVSPWPQPALMLAWHSLRQHLATAVRRWQQARRAAATERALRELSPRLLHDLGLDSSEIPSTAHAAGMGDATRVRMTQPARRLAAPSRP